MDVSERLDVTLHFSYIFSPKVQQLCSSLVWRTVSQMTPEVCQVLGKVHLWGLLPHRPTDREQLKHMYKVRNHSKFPFTYTFP